MNIRIHRGTNQIGGCVVEIESAGNQVFVDFGEQLPGAEQTELNQIEGLTCGDTSKSALFISHYHGDHIGKVVDTPKELPVYIGKTALKIYSHLEEHLSFIPDEQEALKHQLVVERLKAFHTFEATQSIKVGTISVTPLFVDHSAFDAYMFIIEADGKRVLHTGDFRQHGFRGRKLLSMLSKYAKDIDYIISEGTNVSRIAEKVVSESKLISKFKTYFSKDKYSFVYLSSTNVDRIFGLYHAAKATNRCFVCDAYQLKIMKIVSESHASKSDFYKVDYFQSDNPAGRIISLNRRAGSLHSFEGKLKSYLEKHGFCMLIRPSKAFKPLVDEYSKNDGANVFYSTWNGYLNPACDAFNQYQYDFFKAYKKIELHTSGHADVETLKEVFEAIAPKEGIIPIHTESPELFKQAFPRQKIILAKDGELIPC